MHVQLKEAMRKADHGVKVDAVRAIVRLQSMIYSVILTLQHHQR